MITRTISHAFRKAVSYLVETTGKVRSAVAGRATGDSTTRRNPSPTAPSRATIGGSSDSDAATAVSAQARVPDGTVVYAVGDIHGRADLLERLFDLIAEDAASSDLSPHLIMLGDYIDRGLQSRQVIDFLTGDAVSGFKTTFIKGNHEAALLRFLDEFDHGPQWANYGGRETLLSYGVRPPASMTVNEQWREAHQAFRERLPPEHLHFLRSLDLSARVGDYGFVHAGLKPGRPFDEQEERDLLWIRDEFLDATGEEELVIVHGHTPVDDAFSDHRRINVDTGAYFTGRLTAVRLERDQMSFFRTR